MNFIINFFLVSPLTLVNQGCKETSSAQVPRETSTEVSNGNEAKKASITWYTIEQAAELSKKTPKKILVDVYTDWCGWCKKMDATTFKDEAIVNYVNEHFYAVKLNAEQKEDINFNGKVYKNQQPGTSKSPNDFAKFLLNGQMGYPTIVFLDENLANLGPIQSFMDAPTFEPVMHYYGDNSYKTMSWDKFKSTFKGELNAK
jgi:thioredoxin-related protein